MNDSLMNFVGQKLTEARTDLMANGVRNLRGFSETADRIRKSTENLYYSLGNQCFEPVGAIYQAFSDRPGLNDVKNVAGVDIVDINIMATQQSVMSYLSVERGMEKPVDTAFFQKLQAMNTAGGFEKGKTVFHPFSPIGKGLNLGALTKSFSDTFDTVGEVAGKTISITDGKEYTNQKDTPISKGGVTITVTDGNNVVAIGSDKDQDKKVFWDVPIFDGAVIVDHEKGTIKFPTKVASAQDAWKVNAAIVIARTSEDGKGAEVNTLRVKPVNDTVTLKAKPNRIILENSFEDNAYLNKQTHSLASIGVKMDFGKRAVNQLLQLFTFYLDATSVLKTADVMFDNYDEDDARLHALDLTSTSYTLGTSHASTKNDMVNERMLKLVKQLQKQSGKGPTAYLVCSEGAVILGNNPMYFTANANFDGNLDGMIGTYRGFPVIRHHYLDGILDKGGTFAFIGAIHKSPDGQIAPTMYAEYLPPYSIVPALNYDNPAQFSQALLSSSTTDKLVPEVCTYMAIKIA